MSDHFISHHIISFFVTSQNENDQKKSNAVNFHEQYISTNSIY